MCPRIIEENKKPIRAPFVVEFWMANESYDVTTTTTLIKCNTNSYIDPYSNLRGEPYGTLGYSIPGDCYYYQKIAYNDTYTYCINFKDMCRIAKNRGYPLTYGYTPSSYNTTAKRDTFVTEFNNAQDWFTTNNSASRTISIEAVSASTQRKRMLVLALKDWADDTEFTISLGTGFSKTYVGSEIVNNNIVIDLYGKADTATTATLTWIKRSGAVVAAFAQDYIYYINNRNLISAETHLRSDLSVNASTIPSSQVNVTALASEDMYKLYNVADLYNNHLFYNCGYVEDYLSLTPRRFNVTSDLKYQNNTIQIEAEDGISALYNVNMGGLLYHYRNVDLFNDYRYPTSNNEFLSCVTITNTMTRLQFIYWLLFYSYIYSLWENNKDMAKSIAAQFKNDIYNEYFFGTRNIPEDWDWYYKGTEYYGSGSIYYDNTSDNYTKDLNYLGAINDTAPLPLMAWIHDTWHGNITFYDENNVQQTRFFRPQFVDAGRPTFSYRNNQSVSIIKEEDVADFVEIIELPKKKLIIPKRNLTAEFGSKFYFADHYFPNGPDTESFFEFTKEPHTGSTVQDVNVYNYGGGFHYYTYAAHEYPYTYEGEERVYVDEEYTRNPYGSWAQPYKDMLWSHYAFRFDAPATRYDDTVPTQWTIRGYAPVEKYTQSELTNSNVEDGKDIRIEYENLMGPIIDNDLTKECVLGRSNKTGQFTWRGDPRLQPRAIFTFQRLDGTSVQCTIETIETRHEGGGTTQTITYREGIV